MVPVNWSAQVFAAPVAVVTEQVVDEGAVFNVALSTVQFTTVPPPLRELKLFVAELSGAESSTCSA